MEKEWCMKSSAPWIECVNMPVSTGKSKYYSQTDSILVSREKVEKLPGREVKRPEITWWQQAIAQRGKIWVRKVRKNSTQIVKAKKSARKRSRRFVLTSVLAFFSKQEPGSWCVWRGKSQSESKCTQETRCDLWKWVQSPISDPKPMWSTSRQGEVSLTADGGLQPVLVYSARVT